MELYCLKCKKKTDTLNLSKTTSKNGRNVIKGECAICKMTKNQFISSRLNPEIVRDKTSEILEIYHDPKKGVSGINDLMRKTEYSQKEIETALHTDDTYTKHKPIKKKFKRERVYVHQIDQQWQADLVEYIPYADENDNYRYILVVIDCFSKFAWCVPLKNKKAKETLDAFKSIVEGSKRKCERLQTDQGLEFCNKKLQTYCKSQKIEHFYTQSKLKAVIAERFNRTLKTKIAKIMTLNLNHNWIDCYEDLVKNYNNSYHRSIKMTPIEGSKKENEKKVHNNLFPRDEQEAKSVRRYNKGDKVRIVMDKKIFDKGYHPNWTTELFIVDKVFETIPVTYEIKDLNDEKIIGKFYNEELCLYDKKDDVYEIERILKRRTCKGISQILIKWKGYPDTFNSWEAEANFVKK